LYNHQTTHIGQAVLARQPGPFAQRWLTEGWPKQRKFMNKRDLIRVIDHESELLAALEAWARDKTMEERAAKIRRMTIAMGKVPLATYRAE
jgi:hypothetical protein